MILKVFKKEDKQSFRAELKILNKLNGQQGFPSIYSSKKGANQMEILMPALGKSLEEFGKPEMNKIIMKVCIQLTKRLEVLHNLGYIHNDLKPENLLISQDLETVNLIDFGFSEPYLNKDGTHKPSQYQPIFKGNLLYCSTNACSAKGKSRRDDVQSLLHVLSFILNDNLPWCKHSRMPSMK